MVAEVEVFWSMEWVLTERMTARGRATVVVEVTKEQTHLHTLTDTQGGD